MATTSCCDVKFKNTANVKKLSEGNLEFALNLYQTIVRDVGDAANLFCSPFSITAALAMTYAGARGKTAHEMAKSMKLDVSADERDSSEAVHETFADIFDSLNLGRTSDSVLPFTLHCANRMYVHQGYEVLDKYVSTLSNHYGTKPKQVDFARDAEPTRVAINKWVEEVTKNKILNLIGKDVIKCDTRMVLVNAIYFKGAWRKPFRESRTVDDDFFRSPENKVTVKMMFINDKFPYAEDADLGCKLLELPYAGDRLGMYVILPNAVDGLADLERQLTAKVFTALRTATSTVKVVVKLPKFRLEDGLQLADTLRAMGISDLFVPGKADLSGITGNLDLNVSAVIHKAFVEVNEEGTEAAAATAVIMMRNAAIGPVFNFHANHPFIFLIYDHVTDLVLFVGRLKDPGTFAP